MRLHLLCAKRQYAFYGYRAGAHPKHDWPRTQRSRPVMLIKLSCPKRSLADLFGHESILARTAKVIGRCGLLPRHWHTASRTFYTSSDTLCLLIIFCRTLVINNQHKSGRNRTNTGSRNILSDVILA